MTVIVWDGHTLATDRQATDGTHKWEASKAWYMHTPIYGLCIVSGHGNVHDIIRRREWIRGGSDPATYTIDTKYGAEMIVVNKDGLYVYHPASSTPDLRTKPCAFGYGADYAYGALAMGANAEQAVQAANKYSLHCGNGVECFSLTTGERDGEEKDD